MERRLRLTILAVIAALAIGAVAEAQRRGPRIRLLPSDPHTAELRRQLQLLPRDDVVQQHGSRRRLDGRLSPRRHQPFDPPLRAHQNADQSRRRRRTESPRRAADRPELFQCPFIMMTEVGNAYFEPEDAQRLREYLMKGGFLWADDFWGSYAWAHLESRAREGASAVRLPVEGAHDRSPDLPIAVRDEARTPDSVDQLLGAQRWRHVGARVGQRGARARSASPMPTAAWSSSSRTTPTSAIRGSARLTIPTYFYTFSVEGYAFGINVLLYAMAH